MAGLVLTTACGGEKKSAETTNEKTEAGDVKAEQNVVFEDALDGETEGGQPSRWNIYEGTAKVGTVEGKSCIALKGEHVIVMPKVKGSEKNFLGEKYSLEFDFLFGCDAYYHINFFVNDNPDNNLVWQGAQDSGYVDSERGRIDINPVEASWGFEKIDSDVQFREESTVEQLIHDGWNHFSATCDAGSMKIFINNECIGEMTDIKPADYFVLYTEGQYYYEEEADMCEEGAPCITNIRIIR